MANQSGLGEEPYRRPIGYFEARTAAQNLKQYFDLIKVFYHLCDNDERKEILKKYPQIAEANPLAENRLLRTKLNRLSVTVYWALLRLHAPLMYTIEHSGTEYDIDKHKHVKTKRRVHINIILDQFQPNFREDIDTGDACEILVNTFEQAIAVYDGIEKSYWKRIINPVWLIAMTLRIPISLLEYMGINTQNHETNRLIYWLIQAIVLIALAFICLKLGLSINLVKAL